MARALVLICLSTLAAACGARTSIADAPPPPAVPFDDAPFAIGDVLEIRVVNDATLSGRILIGPDGNVTLPYCGSVPLGGLTRDAAHDAIVGCLVRVGAYTTPPALSLRLERSASKVSFSIDHGRVRRDVTMGSGLTLMRAFAQVMEKDGVGMPERVVLVRRGKRHALDVRSILHAEADDLLLEGGDVIDVEGDLALRPAPPRDAPRAPPTLAAAPSVDLGTMFCDDVTRAEGAAQALGKGVQHADVIALERARPRCTYRPREEACAAAAARKAELVGRGLGPNHPDVRAQDEVIAVCR